MQVAAIAKVMQTHTHAHALQPRSVRLTGLQQAPVMDAVAARPAGVGRMTYRSTSCQMSHICVLPVFGAHLRRPRPRVQQACSSALLVVADLAEATAIQPLPTVVGGLGLLAGGVCYGLWSNEKSAKIAVEARAAELQV